MILPAPRLDDLGLTLMGVGDANGRGERAGQRSAADEVAAASQLFEQAGPREV